MNIADLINSGFCKLALDGHTLDAWQDVIDGLEDLREIDRHSFSFAAQTDGFIQREYSQDPSRPDLCERFCYWHANAEVHQKSQFSGHSFYKAVQRFEMLMNRHAESIYRSLKSYFGQSSDSFIRDQSYVQICSYRTSLADEGRRFLQDPHEDGHLFTIAKPTKSGLVILDGHQFIDADLAPNEAMVMAGSLLASLTEDFIKPAIHAVDGISAGKNRVSVLYFVNPDPARELRTWINERPVDIGTQMRVRHTEFGNAPLTIESSRRPEPR